MKDINILIFAMLAPMAAFAQQPTALVSADMIVYNAKVTTQNLAQPDASALAIKGGRIYAVGNDQDILNLKDSKTEVIDAQGRRLIPGLNDAHIHVNMEGIKFNYSLRWDGVPTLKRALEMLSEQAKRTPEGQWVKVIGGWSPYQFKEKRMPTLAELNKAVPNRPFIIQYAYNQAFLNKQAMDAIGIGKPNFWIAPNTTWEKDSKGNYTGIVRGTPGSIMFWAMEGMVPQPSFEESRNSLQQLVHELNHYGLTSITDAGAAEGYPQGHAVVQSLVKDSLLNIRFSFMDIGDANATDNGKSITEMQEEIKSITRDAPISPGQNLHSTLLHGYEYEGAGEAIRVSLLDFENFDQPKFVLDPNYIYQVVEQDVGELVKRRIPFRIHVTYNENISAILGALEILNQKMPFDGLRWALEHAEFISSENIERVKKLGGGIALQDKMALHGDGFIKTYSKEKALQTPPFRELLKSGIPLTLGTDGLRVTTFNPWVSISWAVTGKSVSGQQVLAHDNRLSRAEALKLYTLGSAWFQQDEFEKGRIAPGNLADFALLSDDYFTVPDDRIKHIYSVLTVLDGKVVYGGGSYSKLAPATPEVIPSWSPVKYYGGYYSH